VIDPASVGRRGEPFEMAVELGKIREFARATGSEHPAYLSGECIPPTFLTSDRYWHTEASNIQPAAKLDPQRSLQAEQDFVFHGPPPGAGTVLTAQTRIDRTYEKQGSRGTLTFVELVTEYRDATGRLVAEGRMTGVETPPPDVVQ
jgi:hydroxyacyl-ACP dehydratase HTD2-like protein with hotdog domain